jgi:hypothetical protein
LSKKLRTSGISGGRAWGIYLQENISNGRMSMGYRVTEGIFPRAHERSESTARVEHDMTIVCLDSS